MISVWQYNNKAETGADLIYIYIIIFYNVRYYYHIYFEILEDSSNI